MPETMSEKVPDEEEQLTEESFTKKDGETEGDVADEAKVSYSKKSQRLRS